MGGPKSATEFMVYFWRHLVVDGSNLIINNRCVIPKNEILPNNNPKPTYFLEIDYSENVEKMAKTLLGQMSRNHKNEIIVDIYTKVKHPKEKDILLERWVFSFEMLYHNYRNKDVDSQVTKNFYTELRVLMRSIYSLLLNLPSYEEYQHVKKNVHSDIELNYFIGTKGDSSFENGSSQSFCFKTVEAKEFAKIDVSVEYRTNFNRKNHILKKGLTKSIIRPNYFDSPQSDDNFSQKPKEINNSNIAQTSALSQLLKNENVVSRNRATSNPPQYNNMKIEPVPTNDVNHSHKRNSALSDPINMNNMRKINNNVPRDMGNNYYMPKYGSSFDVVSNNYAANYSTSLPNNNIPNNGSSYSRVTQPIKCMNNKSYGRDLISGTPPFCVGNSYDSSYGPSPMNTNFSTSLSPPFSSEQFQPREFKNLKFSPLNGPPMNSYHKSESYMANLNSSRENLRLKHQSSDSYDMQSLGQVDLNPDELEVDNTNMFVKMEEEEKIQPSQDDVHCSSSTGLKKKGSKALLHIIPQFIVSSNHSVSNTKSSSSIEPLHNDFSHSLSSSDQFEKELYDFDLAFAPSEEFKDNYEEMSKEEQFESFFEKLQSAPKQLKSLSSNSCRNGEADKEGKKIQSLHSITKELASLQFKAHELFE